MEWQLVEREIGERISGGGKVCVFQKQSILCVFIRLLSFNCAEVIIPAAKDQYKTGVVLIDGQMNFNFHKSFVSIFSKGMK